MQIQSTSLFNSQPWLAVFVSPDNKEGVLSTNIFNTELLSWLNDEDFEAKAGEIVLFPKIALKDSGNVQKVAVVGLGETLDYAQAAGKVAFQAKDSGIEGITYYNAEDTLATVLHALIGNYRYDKYKSKKKAGLTHIFLYGEHSSEHIRDGHALANARNFARDLVNAPAADLYPQTLAEQALELADENITVEVWGPERLLEQNMGGIIAVGQGSVNPPRFIHLHYVPEGGATRKIAIVGKGVTFDAGGLSLKSSAGMLTMRCDMGGSATVLGVFHALKSLRPNVEVHGIIGAVENMCAANSFKLGDILTISNGKTVEVHNTDAEGRLVLADCLSFGSKLGVDYMVDFATLTGAAVVALGNYYSGLFTNEEDLAEGLLKSAERTGEGLWRMPLTPLYKPMLKADWADIKNIGGRAAGSITAALFLSEFVENTKWAHVDIAGPAFLDKTFQHFTTGGTGAMVEATYAWITNP